VAEFLDMGGYARYVWTAFGLTTVVLVGNYLAARRRYATTRQRLARKLARQLAAGDD
jgi:heme exporter protein CcmD